MAISREKQKRIYELGQQIPVLSDREIARRLKVSRDSAATYRGPFPGERDVEDGEAFLSPETHIAQQKQIERMRLELARLRGMNRLLTRSGSAMTVDNIVNQFKEELSREEYNRFEFSPKVYPKAKPVKSIFDANHEEIATLILSDLHLSETIRLEESNGVNKYNSIICANRLYKIIDKFKKLVRGHEQMYKIKSIWVPLLGDLINGSIHPEFLITNDLLDIPASILAARLVIMAIHELKTLGLPIKVDCVVGNHSRLVPTMPSKRQAHLSLDWNAYNYIAQKFEGDKQVEIVVHPGQMAIVEHYGHRYLLDHGYGAKAGEALPDRIRRMLDSPVFREATGLQGTSVDLVIIADKHRSESGLGYLVNGCLSGQGEYGVMLRLDPIPAIQRMFGISKSHATTFSYELEATGLIDESACNPMSDYATSYMRQHGRC